MEPEQAELKMIGISLGVTTMDIIINEYIRETVQDRRFGNKVIETKLRRFKHVQRREFMGVVKEDMTRVGVIEEHARNRVRWRQMIQFGCN